MKIFDGKVSRICIHIFGTVYRMKYIINYEMMTFFGVDG